MIYIDSIRTNIQNSIKKSGSTQKSIANKLQISQATISQYISGKVLPALDTFANLCDVLDLDANEILCLHNYGLEKYDKPVKSTDPMDKYEQELFNIFKQLTRDNKMRYLGYGDILLRSQSTAEI